MHQAFDDLLDPTVQHLTGVGVAPFRRPDQVFLGLWTHVETLMG
jgi:hypothetical protein